MDARKDIDAQVLVEDDDAKLRSLGITPVLDRAWTGFSTAMIVMSSMSILTSIIASFDVALIFGGPVVAVWGWVVVSAIVMCVALNMAELSSAYTTSGGMYYWTYRLVGAKYAHFASWVAGWLNLIAQLSGNAAQTALMADLTITLVNMVAAYNGTEPPEFSKGQMYGIYVAWCLAATAANSLGDKVNIRMNEFAGIWNLVGAVVLTIVLPAMATSHQPASYVFGHFETAQAESAGITNPVYVVCLGLLLPAWAFTGLDSAEYMAEETQKATRSQPRAILMGCVAMFVFGLGLILALLFSMPSLEGAIDPESPSGGYAMAQIMYDVFLQRTGSPLGGIVLFALFPLVGVYTCSMSSLTYAARILFSYGRDRLVPCADWWGSFNHRTRTPQNAVWGATGIAILLGLPMLGSSVAFESLLSLSTIALFVLYAGPATLRITCGRRLFLPGLFKLGCWAYPLGVISTLWWIFSLIVFSLPTEYPVTGDNFNSAPVTLGAVLLLASAWYWVPGIGAKKRFNGPSFDVVAFERQLLLGEAESGIGQPAKPAQQVLQQ